MRIVFTSLILALNLASNSSPNSVAYAEGPANTAGAGPGAGGDAFDSARQRLSDAQADFYRASKQPGLTPADLKRIRDQTIGPAQESLQRAIQQEKETTLRKYTRPVGAVAKVEKGRTNSSKKEGSPSAAPGVQLDGQGIQRELEFKPRTPPRGAR